MYFRRISPYRNLFIARAFVVVVSICLIGGLTCVRAQEEGYDAVAVFNQGQDAHEKGDLKAAIELYQKALKIMPEFPEAQLQLGNAFLSLGKIDNAETAFRKAVELREGWSLALASLGSLLVTKEKYAEASPLLAKSVEIDGQNFPALSAMTELLLRTKARPEDLRKLLDRVKSLTAKANPTVSMWMARASLENALGDLAAAKKSLSEVLAVDPKNQVALFQKAEIALKEDDASTAEETAKLLEALTKTSERAVTIHAQALFNSGKTDEALKLINSIVNPSKDSIALKAAMTTATTSNPAELEGALASDPKNSEVLERLCYAYRTADPIKALDLCRRASEAKPDSIKPTIGYGAALVQARRFDEAAALFRRLLSAAPESYTIHGNLATALFELKRYPEAKVEYEWLAKNQPDLAITYFFLAICHDQLREYLDAMANYQQFLKLADPVRHKLEIEKVNLRLPPLLQQIKDKKGAK
ncbi:MAG: tetratricopeptide repeat protein [Acidobacteriota bacterium]